MNERIKELKIEAWDYACSKIPPNALGQKNHEDYFAEKFAELIVRHCAYQCYLIGESGLAHELSDDFGFKFDFKKMMEDEDE